MTTWTITSEGNELGLRPGLIAADELAAELDQAGGELAIVDLRRDRDDGRAKIPGSAWISLHDGFAQVRPERNLQYDLPSPDEFAGALSRLGITPDTAVVLADDMGNRWSTRVYWLMSYYRHPGLVRVLDGGVAAYLRSGHPVVAQFSSPPGSRYPVPESRDESIRITGEQVLQEMESGSLTLCDVRTPEEFRGEVQVSGRGGHIPGAINVPWDQSLDADGTFLPDGRLAKVLAPYLDEGLQRVTYCQGGIRASLTWFALQVLLGQKAKLYAASWEEWAQDPNLPVALQP
jgi:thiosulfate/3-mercaptopyruvate sulfurtransferase